MKLHAILGAGGVVGNQLLSVLRIAILFSKGMMRIAGLFNRTIKESVELAYQSKLPYLFDSSKFNKSFGFVPISYYESFVQL
jgi:hypothetical protein